MERYHTFPPVRPYTVLGRWGWSAGPRAVGDIEGELAAVAFEVLQRVVVEIEQAHMVREEWVPPLRERHGAGEGGGGGAVQAAGQRGAGAVEHPCHPRRVQGLAAEDGADVVHQVEGSGGGVEHRGEAAVVRNYLIPA